MLPAGHRKGCIRGECGFKNAWKNGASLAPDEKVDEKVDERGLPDEKSLLDEKGGYTSCYFLFVP